ncbi:hypothetical protein HDU86_002212 [Geranomyces michiganensis]|nr:hypothetical protein HDU86_002212 [Geranomyces michiganensis]
MLSDHDTQASEQHNQQQQQQQEQQQSQDAAPAAPAAPARAGPPKPMFSSKHPLGKFQKTGGQFRSPTDNLMSPATKKVEAKRNHLLSNPAAAASPSAESSHVPFTTPLRPQLSSQLPQTQPQTQQPLPYPPSSFLNADDQQVISDILAKDDFYARLGISRDASTQKIRSAYLRRSKICHPDRQKHPSAKEACESCACETLLLFLASLPATALQCFTSLISSFESYWTFAVQRLSTAYTTLSEPVNRRQYDLFGKSVDGSDTTFSDALRKVFDEFLEGEYDSIMALVDQIQTLNPEIHISREGTRTVLSSMREFCLWSGRCWSGARGEVVGLYEMHNEIQRLPFLDFRGRLAKTATLSKGIICAVAKCVPAGGVVLEKSMPGIERCEMFFV